MYCIEKFVHLLGNDAGVRIVECLNGEKPVWFQENCKAARTLKNYKSIACWAIEKLGFKGERGIGDGVHEKPASSMLWDFFEME